MGGASPGSHPVAPADVGAIIVAAGRSVRMNGADKMFAPVLGRPLLAHTVAAFESCPAIGSIVLVVAKDNVEQAQSLAKAEGWRKVSRIIAGGARRQDSVKRGLQGLPPCRWVVVHDGARPCVEAQTIERGLEAAQRAEAAVAAVPVTDTIKRVDAEQRVVETLERGRLWAAQTPQVFRRDLLTRAHNDVDVEVTDDAALVERLGHPVVAYMGSYRNIKVTTVDDLALAEAYLREAALPRKGA